MTRGRLAAAVLVSALLHAGLGLALLAARNATWPSPPRPQPAQPPPPTAFERWTGPLRVKLLAGPKPPGAAGETGQGAPAIAQGPAASSPRLAVARGPARETVNGSRDPAPSAPAKTEQDPFAPASPPAPAERAPLGEQPLAAGLAVVPVAAPNAAAGGAGGAGGSVAGSGPSAAVTTAGGGGALLGAGGPADPTAELNRRLADSARRCYPPAAARFRLRGAGRLQFCVDAGGTLASLSLSHSTGSALLDRAARDCVVQGALPLPVGSGCYGVPVRFDPE